MIHANCKEMQHFIKIHSSFALFWWKEVKKKKLVQQTGVGINLLIWLLGFMVKEMRILAKTKWNTWHNHRKPLNYCFSSFHLKIIDFLMNWVKPYWEVNNWKSFTWTTGQKKDCFSQTFSNYYFLNVLNTRPIHF